MPSLIPRLWCFDFCSCRRRWETLSCSWCKHFAIMHPFFPAVDASHVTTSKIPSSNLKPSSARILMKMHASFADHHLLREEKVHLLQESRDEKKLEKKEQDQQNRSIRMKEEGKERTIYRRLEIFLINEFERRRERLEKRREGNDEGKRRTPSSTSVVSSTFILSSLSCNLFSSFFSWKGSSSSSSFENETPQEMLHRNPRGVLY